MQAGTLTRDDRSILERSSHSRLPDQLLRWVLTGLAGFILVLIAFFFIRLYIEAKPAFDKFGYVGFTFTDNWDVAKNVYGALPLLVGTLITAALALLLGVPVAVGTALYLTEFAPRRARGTLTIMVEMLAAVPSVVYGLWGVFVLIPKLKPAEQWFSDTFAFLPFVGGTVSGPNYFIGGLILAIMIVPIVTSLSREVIATVPSSQREAAYGMGATRWEMIRYSVLPWSRGGITGSVMLGLGRAMGETIAVALVIGSTAQITTHVFLPGDAMAAVIANQFGEAGALHKSALIGLGVVLFVITILVNVAARGIVTRLDRRTQGA